ncbi:VWA containing CoxE family protein [Desulfarculus baarsii DSM 2075]|uniref:VWA containing CoxE family protein n=1 Tax=Desulfarculus baarsii (strain ATCC 33931 / DSM 2075 / LMG 7858 / VKM B-1802 / 2st14) TaxID=644282 RepID=E1QL05_DESB2|nr:VWA domain-containing protein [Desulfarculus baarsii]ADK85270.1 VWA containing CoxE family protein [Desulfarculus baarsii DSM 2075]
MFLNLFYTLRHAGVPVSVTEWMTLMMALDQGHADNSLSSFYYLARAILVKSEAFYDQFDQSFAHVFKDAEMPKNIRDEILDWLSDPANKLELPREELERMKALSLEELRREFEKRLEEQTEAHHGGNRWIGTGGTSPFGHSGANPAGMRIGGPGGGGTAVKIAAMRKFRNYRDDLTLDVRQMKVAMKRLRQLEREGPEDELDIDGTIDKTCRDGGEIDLVFRRPRQNTVKVLLLMDSGGSMNPYARLVSQLFSAAHQMSHFRDFKHYYFHNCVYQELYKDIRNFDGEPTGSILKNIGSEYKVIFVGDACMAPSELFSIGGVIDYYSHNDTPGIEWLRRFAEHFRYCVWLNPMPERTWFHTTIQPVARLIPMFPLTLDGLERAVQRLIVRH